MRRLGPGEETWIDLPPRPPGRRIFMTHLPYGEVPNRGTVSDEVHRQLEMFATTDVRYGLRFVLIGEDSVEGYVAVRPCNLQTGRIGLFIEPHHRRVLLRCKPGRDPRRHCGEQPHWQLNPDCVGELVALE